MADQNPIKYSDLISPDDSIEKLIGQLESLNSTYNQMAQSIIDKASSVAGALRAVSGATAQGQSATRSAATEADKLAKAYEQLNFSRTETARKIQELKMAQQEENRITKLQIILNNTEEGSYAHLSAQYSLNKMQLNQLTAAERENLPHAKKLEEETKKIYEEMKRLQEATGKYSLNVGNYTNSITQAIGVNTRWYQGLQELAALTEGGLSQGLKTAGTAVASFGKQLLALMANPIVLTITAITAAFMALAKGISTSEENTNALNRILAPFKRILTEVLDVIQGVATGVLKVVEGFENLAMGASRLMERLPLVGSAFKKVNDELQKNIDLERERQQLQKDNRTLTKQEAKTQYEIAVLRRKAQETDDPKERAAYLQKAVNKERQMSKNRVEFLQRELKVMKEKAAQSQNDAATNDAIAQKEAEIWNARAQAEQRSLRMVRQIATANKQLNSSSGGGKNTGKNQVDLAKQQLEERRKIEDATIALVEDANLRERMTILASYERKIEDLKGSEEYITQMTVLLEQQKQQKLADLYEKEQKQAADAEKKDLETRLKATDNLIKQREQAIRQGEEAIAQQYELDTSYAELEQNENRKTDMRLKAEKKRLQALLDLYQKDGKVLTDVEVQTLKNSIAQVDQEIEKNTKGKDIYDLLGLNLDDDKKQAISDSFAFALDNLSEYLDAWVQAAEKKAQIAEQEVERAKSVVDSEIEARNKGYASNVAEAQKELELARRTQQKALQEQQRAQKAQQALASVQQATNLISASALIWSQLGFPWAIPAIAVMWGSFAAAKIKAAQVTSMGDEEYGEGTVELLEGGSHQSGNDVDLGRKKNGQRRRAEGGEYFAVINKRNSRRFRHLIPDVINSLNDGTFAQKYQRAYDDGGINVSVQQSPDIRSLSNDVRLIREQGEQSSTFDANGNEIIRYKNLRRIIKS